MPTLAPPSTDRPGGAPQRRTEASCGHRSHRLGWREHPAGWAPHGAGQLGVILHVVQDWTWSQMWRVWMLDGRLSDLVNLPRARDVARRAAPAAEARS